MEAEESDVEDEEVAKRVPVDTAVPEACGGDGGVEVGGVVAARRFSAAGVERGSAPIAVVVICGAEGSVQQFLRSDAERQQ
jgi:hypothetical protein